MSPTSVALHPPKHGKKPKSDRFSRFSTEISYLHLLDRRKRADLMGALATLYPAILHLGGEDAGRGMVGEMTRICRQWK